MTGATPRQTYYFSYGSNLWLHQMRQRCPSHTLVGTCILPAYRWIISGRGYANVVPSPDDVCYGVLYTLSPADEAYLDICEGVPRCYGKQFLSVTTLDGRTVDRVLVYIDGLRVVDGISKAEYVTRINNGLKDARDIPPKWVEKYIRRFIPAGQEEEVVVVGGG
jgi:hypothetical protein